MTVRNMLFFVGILSLMAAMPATDVAAAIVSLDGSRTGDELEAGGDRFLTSPAMANATQILQTAGFTVTTTNLFVTANIAGAGALYTGSVDVGFTAQEIADVQAYVNAGGGLVIQRDWAGFYPAADPLAAAFGVTYNTGPFGPSQVGSAVNMTLGHPIWNGPAGSVTTYDQVLSSSVIGATGIGVHSTAPAEVAIAVTTFGAGRVVFLTDQNAWDDFGDPTTPTPGSNNAIVWENIFQFAVPEPGTLGLLILGGLLVARRRH